MTTITIIITRIARTLPFPPKLTVSWSRAEGINLLKNKCRVRRQAVIKVLTDQSASDSEPAIILTESNEHSKPCSAPNMKGDVICWQLASRRGSRRGERMQGGEKSRRGRERGVSGEGAGGRRREECGGQGRPHCPVVVPTSSSSQPGHCQGLLLRPGGGPPALRGNRQRPPLPKG